MRKVVRFTLAALLVGHAGCHPEVHEGEFLCAETSDCPGRLICERREKVESYCYHASSSLRDAGPDSSSDDAETDADAYVTGTPDTDASDAEPADATIAPDASPACVPQLITTRGVFVAAGQGGTIASSCGSAATPCATITQGIARAKSMQLATVFIGPGSYAESIVLAPGIALRGGLERHGDMWSTSCASDRFTRTTINAANGLGLLAEFAGSTTVEGLSVHAVALQPGASQHAIIARGAATSLTLIDVIAEARAGVDGEAGMPGQAGAPSQGLCGARTGARGASGAQGTASPPGMFGPNGYTSVLGGNGGSGEVGMAGAEGQAPCITCARSSEDCIVRADGECTAQGSGSTTSCGRAGSSGCGGGPGQGGRAGQGGGASIALMVHDATVRITRGELRAGNGGTGGAGGAGGPGGAGAPGTRGADGSSCSICKGGRDDRLTIDPNSQCRTTPTAPLGALGGTGGEGGAGGAGADGAAGPSYAIYGMGRALVERSLETRLVHGEPGVKRPNGAAAGAGDEGGMLR